jgi:hypothetical protein
MCFSEYKKDILDFESFDSAAKEGYEERLGEPEELSSIIGLISIAFNDLEGKVSEGISILLHVDEEIGAIITSELSYRMKVNMFSSLIQKFKTKYYFNRMQGDGFKDGYLPAFIKALLLCEDLRNKVLHSVFLSDNLRGNNKLIRKKVTAKAKKGLVITNEKTEISHLLNIYDFTVSMQMEIDDFFIDFHRLDQND